MVTLSVFAPLFLIVAAAAASPWSGLRAAAIPRCAEAAAALALLAALAGGLQFAIAGTAALGTELPLLRIDRVEVMMSVLVGFVGWVVVRYARTYLAAELRERSFHALILATLAAVFVLILAGNLAVMTAAFVAIGAVIGRLLLFYPDRPEARRAAAKFRLVWGAGDAALVGAAVLFWLAFGTLDFATIAAAASAGPLPGAAMAATALVVVAALLKTAAFPVHGWLTEVMEAPTPVSALLHAGVINAGGLLLLRLAEPMQGNTAAMAALVMIGGLTALFGAMVMLTQSAIKTALAWSTVAQMGFMILQCGLGLWALALLHIVAHSLYKAHAFLASGSAVRGVAAARRPGPVAVPGVVEVTKAFVLAIVLYGVIAAGYASLVGPKSPQALALGAILVFGVAYLVAQGLADRAPTELTRRTAVASLAVTVGYFGFHALAEGIAAGALPAPPTPGPLEWALIVLVLASFGVVAVAQALFPHWAHHPAAAGLRIHVTNGVYINAAFDRLIDGFWSAQTS